MWSKKTRRRSTRLSLSTIKVAERTVYFRQRALYVCQIVRCKCEVENKEEEWEALVRLSLLMMKVAKRAIYFRQGALYFCQRALYSAKQPCVIVKWKNKDEHKALVTDNKAGHKSRIFPQKSCIFPQKNPVHLPKSPVFLQKSPVLCKRALCSCKRALYSYKRTICKCSVEKQRGAARGSCHRQ